jgi:hypothetical protein
MCSNALQCHGTCRFGAHQSRPMCFGCISSPCADVHCLTNRCCCGGGLLICLTYDTCVNVQAFDELLLIKRGGRTIFFGETGQYSRNLINYFEVCY